MSQPLPFDEIKFHRNVCSNEFLNTPDDNPIGSFLEVDLRCLHNIGQKTEYFPLAPASKIYI